MPRLRREPPGPVRERLRRAGRDIRGRHRRELDDRRMRHRQPDRPAEQGRHLAVLVQHAGRQLQRAREIARGQHRRRQHLAGDHPGVLQLL